MIGEGSFAFVYRAIRREPLPQHCLPANTPVALKVISKSKLTNDHAIRDVIKEVEIGRKLNHPGCVKVLEVLQSASEIFIVMELVDGVELFEVIRSAPKGRLSEAVACQITTQLLSAVHYLHTECRVVHRDLKPENVLVSGEPGSATNPLQVRVVDFGLAKYIGTSQRRGRLLAGVSANRMQAESSNFHQRAGFDQRMPQRTMSTASVDSMESASSHATSPLLTTPCGTLKYNAPEAVQTMMAHGGELQRTTKGDLVKREMYSIGAVVYVMLSGQLPFTATTKSALLQQMTAGPSFASARWSNVSETAKQFVAALLHADPAQRPTAKEALGHQWTQPYAPEFSPVQNRCPAVPSPNQAACDEDDVNIADDMGRRGMALAFDAVNDQLTDDAVHNTLPSSHVPQSNFTVCAPRVIPVEED
uniref:Protein kinase domain-containing protein n=1 Tax=Neobodo designis TaxID=312471 RepID=A0A7S1W5S2_NEODS